MKIKSLVICGIIAIFLFSCSNNNSEPFDAEFTGEYARVISGDELTDCDEEFECRVIVNFEGSSSQFGNFSGQFSFCACGPDGKYSPTESYMIFAEGDTLIVSCHGTVIAGRTDEHPEFVTSYWRDPFVIKGGTGRFEGATGGGTTDDYNSSLDPNSHHNWKGKIKLSNNRNAFSDSLCF